ncbi:MAG: hypothetical protein ACREBU_11440 [Nitrososphaera sp.]
MPSHTKSERAKKRAFREVEQNEPSIVGKTRRKKGAKAAEKQKIAIALSKAREMGAKIPKPKGGKRPHGSGVFTDADLSQGYKGL